jgi:hypothetical protein
MASSNYIGHYCDSVEAELQIVEKLVGAVRDEIAQTRKQKAGSVDFGRLRNAMVELAHASSLLRTGHPADAAIDKPVHTSELVSAPVDNAGTWPHDAESPEVHRGKDGLNAVAAQRHKDNVKQLHDGELLPHPTDTQAALADERHAGK